MRGGLLSAPFPFMQLERREWPVRVSMKVQISGVRDGVRWPEIGGEIVVPDAEGAELCAQGFAVPVAEVAKSEKRPAKRAVEKRG